MIIKSKNWLGLLLLVCVIPANAFDFSRIDLNKIGDVISKTSDALQEVDEPREIEIGSGLASTLLGAVPLVNDPELQRYINDIGMWLAMQTERKHLPWRFGVVDTDAINAFATPGGYVFITRGLFESLRDEAELAGVLAHEIGHVLEKHHLNAIQKGARMGIAAGVASIAADQKGHDIDALVNTGMELYARGLDKEDEFAADKAGVVIAARGGYHPNGLLGVLQTLDNLNPEDGALTLMFKTHPPPSDRLSSLQAAMTDKLDSYQQQPTLATRLAEIQTSMESR